MMLPQFQELSDFSQGETQALHLPDKIQPGHVIIGYRAGIGLLYAEPWEARRHPSLRSLRQYRSTQEH